MSVLNAFVTPDCALLGVDTEGVLPNGEAQHGNKAITLPHLGAALGFRGLDWMLIAMSSTVVGWKGTYDELAAYAPTLMNNAATWCRTDKNLEPQDANVVLVGFSESAGRMVGHAFLRKAGSDDVERHHDINQFLAPMPDSGTLQTIKNIGARADKNGMALTAMHQCKMLHRVAPESSGGGRFFVSKVTLHSITTEMVCVLPERPSKEAA
ncbi:hypothetical protein [Pseudomonas pseudonitroreducens]|uniref:hypothetical protein n=1 Tax=Pseudomonas pseudonitroreducens TaxID=2892326 RepID=UPI001F21FC7B|nr:hypothetical protein [Pseudomonas pseudonitroreducens]